MTTTIIASSEDVYAERWREWQLANAASSRKSAVQARIVFTAIFIALAGWLGLALSS